MTTNSFEPLRLVSGDSISWRRLLADYRADDGWSLHYRLLSPDTAISIDAAQNGTGHLVTLTATTTGGYVPGRYDWTAYVTKGADRVTIGTGVLTIAPDPTALQLQDGRTQAERILAALMAAYEGYCTNGQGTVAEYEIVGRRMKFRSSAEILEQIQYWRLQVANEQTAARIARGDGSGRRIQVRFGR